MRQAANWSQKLSCPQLLKLYPRVLNVFHDKHPRLKPTVQGSGEERAECKVGPSGDPADKWMHSAGLPTSLPCTFILLTLKNEDGSQSTYFVSLLCMLNKINRG